MKKWDITDWLLWLGIAAIVGVAILTEAFSHPGRLGEDCLADKKCNDGLVCALVGYTAKYHFEINKCVSAPPCAK